jgi:hypothetical protein
MSHLPTISDTRAPAILGTSLVAAWGLSVETGHPFESEHRQRRQLLRLDADNDVTIGPDVVGQIPIGSNDPATIPS